MRLMKAESLWSYPAFFDYVDRWMTGGKPCRINGLWTAAAQALMADVLGS